MTAQTERSPGGEQMQFQAEVTELLQIMIHSLYSHREIFLRELISNASDALDKLRIEALTESTLLEGDQDLAIRLEADPEGRTLRVIDNGIGMSREEVIDNIGTIARSGTRRFLEQLHSSEQPPSDVPRLIGQFGVGFYSSFMVADEVVVETRRAGQEAGTRWASKGDGQYTVEELPEAPRGTSVTLHLKPVEEHAEGEFTDFCAEWTLRQVVRRYSDFVEYPIQMDVERQEGEGDERKTVTKTETLNSMKPLWTRPKGEVSDEEYNEFYKHVSHDWSDPLERIHFQAEGAHSYTALLFVPAQRPMDLFDPSAGKSKVELYVKRVHIMSECEELMPVWLRFIRGLVDSDDLPLNIARETLQHSRQIGQINKRLVRKVLDTFERLLANDREKYLGFWNNFGRVLEEGVYYDSEQREEVAKLCLFPSTAGEELCTLGEYVARMPEDQEAIYYLVGESRAALEASPHLEALKGRGLEVLLLVNDIDELAMERLSEFDGKPLRSIDRGQGALESDEEQAAREERQEADKDFLEAVGSALEEHVGEVRYSTRLADSAVVLVADDSAPTRAQQRMMRELNQDMPAPKRALELNPEHPLVQRLTALQSEGSERFGDYCDLLLGQALLSEGSSLPDPQRFSKLLSELMVGAPH